MSDIKWIKILTNIFDDDKMRFIENLPDGDTIIVIWFKILTLAGRSNKDGYIMLTDQIPYTEEMLKSYLGRKDTIVKLAFQTFKKLQMIEVVDEQYLLISNWSKHQNTSAMERIKEQNRLRQAKYREKNKYLLETKDKEKDKKKDIRADNVISNVTRNVTEDDTPLGKAFEDFYKHRKSIKAPMGDNAKKLLKSKLDKLAKTEEDKIAILEQSILNGWKGVFPIKTEYGKTQSRLKENQTKENTEKSIGYNL